VGEEAATIEVEVEGIPPQTQDHLECGDTQQPWQQVPYRTNKNPKPQRHRTSNPKPYLAKKKTKERRRTPKTDVGIFAGRKRNKSKYYGLSLLLTLFFSGYAHDLFSLVSLLSFHSNRLFPLLSFSFLP